MSNTPPTGTTPTPTPAPTPNPIDNASLTTSVALANQAQDAFTAFGDVAGRARDVLTSLTSRLDSVNTTLKANQSLTQGQTSAFGAMTVAALGARTAFSQLTGVDFRNLDTFTTQLNDLKTILGDNTSAFGAGTAGGQALVDMLVKAKAPIGDIAKAVADGGKALLGFAQNFFTSADNALRLQHSIIQLAASTGQLNKIYDAAGPNLANINFLTQQYQKMITDSGVATGLTAAQVEVYFAELGNIPGTMETIIADGKDMNANVSMLTATIQFATGSGRKFEDVTKDLRTAFRDYNITGQDALQFTARMGELANRFGIELSDVQNNLTATAEAFRMYGNEAEGAARLTNQYLGALKETGISGATALNVIQDMTKGIQGMGIAQKAFVSSQTGGPGGLMGAFQIEQMLREGKLDEVMNKVRQTLEKQFGQIVTLQEAANSPQAAAQLTKQMMVLRQGPLGSIVRDDQSAMRLLEAMRGQAEGRPGSVAAALSTTVVQDSMKVGVDLQQKSETHLRRMVGLMEEARGAAGMANLGTAQRALTAGTGAEIGRLDTRSQAVMRDNLIESMARSAADSGATVAGMITDLGAKKLTDQGGAFTTQTVNHWKKFFSDIGPAMRAPIDEIRGLFSAGKTKEATAAAQQLIEDTERRKTELKNAPIAIRQSQMASAGLPTIDINDIEIPNAIPTNQVAAAAATVANRQTTPTGSPTDVQMHPNMAAATETTPGALGEITVHVDGFCLDCGERIKGTTQRLAVAPQTRR